MSATGPLLVHTETVKPQWIDYNGHLNVAYYMLIFDAGTEALLDSLGLDAGYRERSQTSTFVLETHINYEHEVQLGAVVDIYAQLVDYDLKRIHYALFMQHQEAGFLAACCEIILMQIDMQTTRSASFPDFAMDNLAALSAEQAQLPPPPRLGSVIGIRR